MSHPLRSEDPAAALIDLLNEFPWATPRDALLLCGWAASAPLCFSLRQRPHLFLTGPAASGKTTILRHLYSVLMPQPMRFIEGAMTEVGAHEVLQAHGEFPILYDEATDAGAVRAFVNSGAMCCFAAIEAPIDLAQYPTVIPVNLRRVDIRGAEEVTP